ncbi:AtzH-like domain-containing protein [uncultured Aeromicrobium sp.]|uniref:AtzH-like domain-containing protein n=1 Tax=uncultured Aeromicrobium sp. TaxID=337820 RepID=UPI0025E7A977|nr:AtzH-like domain-containing protein [uncultured Aeromicrobium sp.]
MDHPAVPVHTDRSIPDGVLEAFWEYDRALLANDVEALDALFAPGPDTLRADGDGVLSGHEAIASFRAARTQIPRRRVTALWLRVLSERHVYTTAQVRSPAGAEGLQTQLWTRIDDRWRVAAAHVTAPRTAVDPTVWRVVGAPLVEGSADGPLHGETIAVKDLFAVAGVVRSAGVRRTLAGQRPAQEHAAAVRSLLEAGADVVGVAHTDQFAFGLSGRNADFGTPANPAAPDRLPGGSTSGPAVAVRRGWASVGLGTDTAGSIRVPASYQGLWSMRPTHGVVDVRGVLALAPSFDTVGWLARDAETVRRVADVLLPPAAESSELAAVIRSRSVEAGCEAPVREVMDRYAAAASAADAPELPDLDQWTAAFRTVQAAEAWREHGAWLSEHPDAVAADVAGRFAFGRQVGADDEERARAVLRTARTRLIELIGDGCLLLPVVSSSVPRLDTDEESLERHRAGTLRLTTLASMAGLPALAFPAGTVGGGPFGLSLVGGPGRERALLRRGVELTSALG